MKGRNAQARASREPKAVQMGLLERGRISKSVGDTKGEVYSHWMSVEMLIAGEGARL